MLGESFYYILFCLYCCNLSYHKNCVKCVLCYYFSINLLSMFRKFMIAFHVVFAIVWKTDLRRRKAINMTCATIEDSD